MKIGGLHSFPIKFSCSFLHKTVKKNEPIELEVSISNNFCRSIIVPYARVIDFEVANLFRDGKRENIKISLPLRFGSPSKKIIECGKKYSKKIDLKALEISEDLPPGKYKINFMIRNIIEETESEEHFVLNLFSKFTEIEIKDTK